MHFSWPQTCATNTEHKVVLSMLILVLRVLPCTPGFGTIYTFQSFMDLSYCFLVFVCNMKPVWSMKIYIFQPRMVEYINLRPSTCYSLRSQGDYATKSIFCDRNLAISLKKRCTFSLFFHIILIEDRQYFW
jgi:hypothetical protein